MSLTGSIFKLPGSCKFLTLDIHQSVNHLYLRKRIYIYPGFVKSFIGTNYNPSKVYHRNNSFFFLFPFAFNRETPLKWIFIKFKFHKRSRGSRWMGKGFLFDWLMKKFIICFIIDWIWILFFRSQFVPNKHFFPKHFWFPSFIDSRMYLWYNKNPSAGVVHL